MSNVWSWLTQDKKDVSANFKPRTTNVKLRIMTENWESIYVTPLPHRAELAKALLLEHDIPAVIVNKQSSSYPTIGWGKSEVHVPAKDAILAKVILENEATFS